MNTAGDSQGLIEKFAHTRNFTQINFDFMVDNEYKTLKFLEHWMEYISGQSYADPTMDSYHLEWHIQVNINQMTQESLSLEKSFSILEYRFVGLFPLSLILQEFHIKILKC